MLYIKKPIDKFCKQTEEYIEIAIATALQEWCKKALELQVIRAYKENREIEGPGFWKLDKANVEAVQANLKVDFQRIALTHHKEIAKLLTKQREYVKQIADEALSVAEPVRPAADESILHILDDDDAEEEDPAESG